ncbi:MAG: hypothetical protein QOJ02_3311 [Acidobacteriota bacterium]|jgi:hypothetical protein|nr:hypothetical protein [Acidobacteriota bacterium]
MKFAMKKGRLSFALLAFLFIPLLLASTPASDAGRKDTARLPFDSPEELVYEGEFSRSLLRGINVAELRFTANRAQVSAQPSNGTTAPTVLRFSMDAVTKGILRKLFGLNYHQRVESTVEPATFSVLQTTKLDEQGKRKRTSEAVFDKNAGKVVWTERDPNDPTREPRVVTSPASGAVQDIASAFYYLRTQPLELGKNLEVLVSDSGQVYHIPVIVSERKRMKTVLGEVQTLKVEPDIFGDNRLLRGKGKLAIWFTDDARHIPVRARINNELGTLDIKLKRMTGSKTGERR